MPDWGKIMTDKTDLKYTSVDAYPIAPRNHNHMWLTAVLRVVLLRG